MFMPLNVLLRGVFNCPVVGTEKCEFPRRDKTRILHCILYLFRMINFFSLLYSFKIYLFLQFLRILFYTYLRTCPINDQISIDHRFF